MIKRSTSRGKAKGVYHPTSMCEVCERPIVERQTWKFTPDGGKVHYYCAQANPAPAGDIRTLTQGIFEHAGGRPHRAYSIAKAAVRNEHGVLETYTVYVNRTHNKWWLEKVVGEEPDLSEGWMSPKAQLTHRTLFYEFATSSPKKGQEWIDAVNRLAGGVANPAGSTLEPWQMTRSEYKSYLEVVESERLGYRRKPRKPSALELAGKHTEWDSMVDNWRRQAVVEALREGKPVPSEVLRDFPDLRENPAGLTYIQAMTQARAAGARIGDTSGFEPWLRKAKLDGRSPLVVGKLKAAFWEGVDRGETKAVSGEEQDYHGARIWKTAEGWKASLDPDSTFDNLRQVQRFVDAQRNPASYEEGHYVVIDEDYRVLSGPHKSLHTASGIATDLAKKLKLRGHTVSTMDASDYLVEVGRSKPSSSENPFDFETGARNFGMNIGVGRSPRIQVVKGRLRKAQKELAEHRSWLKSKGYDDDGVATRMERNIQWLEIALQEYARKKNPGGFTELLPPASWPEWVDDNQKKFLEAVWRAGSRTDQQTVRSTSLAKVKTAARRYYVGSLRTLDDTSLPLWLSPLMSDPTMFSIIKTGETVPVGRIA